MYSLGIDVGSSSVKVALLDIAGGKCVCSSTNPKSEAPIKAVRKGWAEQDPQSWWKYMCDGIREMAAAGFDMGQVASIGISYQMHGLVAVDKDVHPVRDAIIWCDSRAVQLGEEALKGIGYERCMEHLLNSPGNFTASKLAWVKENEPDIYAKIWKFMLPGDYIAYRLTGEVTTTATGLSEGIMWDFAENRRADFVTDYYGIGPDKFADIAPALGVLLCINGTGIMNAWARRNMFPDLSYAQMNELAASAPAGSDGLLVLPFGNGAERVLSNTSSHARLVGIDLVRHGRGHILRAIQEGIAFSFRYGIDIMKNLGLKPDVIRAGKANMFLSPLFRSTLASLCDSRIELFDTDGSLGAARGAALGAGIYKSAPEAFSSLTRLDVIEPEAAWKQPLEDAYARWKYEVEESIK